MQVVAGQTISLGQVAQPNQDNVPHYRFALVDPVGPAQQVTYPDRTDETANNPELSKLAKLANLAKLAKKNREAREATEAREKESKVRRARIEK